MKKVKKINVFFGIVLIAVIGGFVFLNNNFQNTKPSKDSDQKVLMDMVNYRDYSENNLSVSKKSGKTVLFFAATKWCQTCIMLEREIKERLSEIPSDITILKVDYDNDKQMKTKYRVTQQHYLIVLDENGKEVKRWIGGNFDLMLNELKEI